VATGVVVLAKDVQLGWGNVVIIRHAYFEKGELRTIDSLYGHLANLLVHEGQVVRRGQHLGGIGDNRGMYDAHLHFEIRKNLEIGMNRASFPRDDRNYIDPTPFMLPGGKLRLQFSRQRWR
jgi:murein DD-endopeptidase MepM/ murein hydrolase activator NlpD